MRIVKILLTFAAVVAAILGGVFAALIAAVTILAMVVNRRLFGRRPALVRSPARRSRAPASPEAIEVVATEIKDAS